MGTPRASFVIPAHNAECWISKAIQSCLGQTEKKIEIIIVDDGSTDDTRLLIEHFSEQDKRVVPLILPENKGRSYARNAGNKIASSEIIMVLDSDDMATKTRARDTIAAFQLKGCDLLYGSFYVIDSIGNVVQKVLSKEFDPVLSKEKRFNFICHSTLAYKKSLAQEIFYDENEYSKLGLDDWKFQWDAYRKGAKFFNAKNPLCYYRERKDNTVNTRDQSKVDALKESYLVSL